MTIKHQGYDPGHPWYYKLGGTVLKPKAIRNYVAKQEYSGYRRDEIAAADNEEEPARSAALRALRGQTLRELERDLSRYRQLVFQLRQHRCFRLDDAEQPICADIHTSVSLKFNHLVNDFAHLLVVEEKLSQQMDLLDLLA